MNFSMKDYECGSVNGVTHWLGLSPEAYGIVTISGRIPVMVILILYMYNNSGV